MQNPSTCAELLDEYKRTGANTEAAALTFEDVGGRDVYNITAPFTIDGLTVIAGRVEARDTEFSEVVFFSEANGVWQPIEGAPIFKLQDPFITWIGDELILGGVEVFPDPEKGGALGWRTNFYRGRTLTALEKFTAGPDGMKDIRLAELPGGGIGVFTRPQGEKGGRGKIGYMKIDDLGGLTAEAIAAAPLIEGQFTDEEWGGANETHILNNGLIGVLGHIASFDAAGNRHYYSMCFVFDPATEKAGPLEMIATRGDFLEGPAKRPDLVDVVFSGGLVRAADGTAELYAGISDAGAQKLKMNDPFLKYENEELNR